MLGLKSKEWFTFLVITLFLVDIVILLDIPFLRSVFAFLYFTTIPGLLILYILRLNKLDIVKKFVLSIGLSISFLIFAGLLINTLLPSFGIPKPLSALPLLISFNVILIILCFIGYKKYEGSFHFLDISTIKSNIGGSFISPLLFAFLFPFLAIFGVYFMNTTENNIILLVLPFLTVIYAAFITYFNKKIPKITYSIAILAIAISFILIIPLRGEYLILGGDGNLEYYIFRLISTNMHWDMDYYRNSVNACLGGGLLHTIYFSLLNISREWIFKLIYPLIFSITPLCLFILSKKYIGRLYAFLVSLFFISQYSFIYIGIGSIRIAIGLFFFALAMMVFFDDEINQTNKRTLFLIFTLSLIVSYYTFSYMFFFLILFSWLVLSLIGTIKPNEFEKNIITLTTVMLSAVVIFFWYSQITESHFNTLISFFENSIKSVANLFIIESRGEIAEKTFARGLEGEAEIINLIVYYITLILIGIGSVDLVIRCKKSKFGIEYTTMVMICLIFLLLTVAIPYLTSGSVGLLRVYFFTTILLAQMLSLGADVVRKITASKEGIYNIKRLKSINSRLNSDRKNIKNDYLFNYHWLTVLILLVVITSQFMVNTGITYQMFGDHRSIILNSEGLQYNIWYIHPQEITAGKWLIKNNEEKFKLCGDYYLWTHLSPIKEEKLEILGTFFLSNKPISQGYIFLRYQNVVKGEIVPFLVRKIKEDYVPLANYSHLFIGKSKIYSNGGSEVWR